MSVEILRISILNREHWLNLRMHDITATDVPAICGEGMFNSAASVWAVKKGLLPPATETAAMRRGRWGEAAVFEAIADTYPDWELRRAKVYLRDAAARLGATPDGVAIIPGHDGITYLEAKVVMRPVFVRDWCAGEDDADAPISAPIAYQLQTLTGAMLADAAHAIIAVLVHDTYDWQLRIVPIERHAGAEQTIRSKVAEFWERYLDANICPPIDARRDNDLIKNLFPHDDGSEIDLSCDNRLPQLLDDLVATKASIKHLESDKKAIETEIKGKLGNASSARICDGRVVSWRMQHRSGYAVAPTDFRVLRISNR